METKKTPAIAMALIALSAIPLRAQEKEKPRDEVTPLQMEVVFTEYQAEKKISSLPYTIPVTAAERNRNTRLRMGIRVPINTGGVEGKTPKFTYQDVGTNLDCWARPIGAGLFEVVLNAERSSLKKGPGISEQQPLFSQFYTQLNLIMRDGQTLQSTMATDPVTGSVLKIDVTLRVAK